MFNKKITIIDYGCGNILNLARAIKFLGCEVEITHDKKKIISSSHVILPGVGAFENAIGQLEKYNLRNTILEYTKLNKPLLGICLGMQILLTVSHEFGTHKGLNLIEGEVINGSDVRLIRDGAIKYTGKISSIFREKNQAKQVSNGQECGITLKDFIDFQKNDIIEAYKSTSTERKI